MGLLFYGIIKCLPGIVIVALSPLLAVKEGVELLSRKKDKTELRYLPFFMNIAKAVLILISLLLFFPIINTYGTFKRGKQTLGTLMIFGCILIYGCIALVVYFEYLS